MNTAPPNMQGPPPIMQQNMGPQPRMGMPPSSGMRGPPPPQHMIGPGGQPPQNFGGACISYVCSCTCTSTMIVTRIAELSWVVLFCGAISSSSKLNFIYVSGPRHNMAPMRPSGGPPPPRMDGGFRPRAPMMHPGPRPRMPGPSMPLSEEEFYNIKKKLIEKEERRLVELLKHATCTVALASLKCSSALDSSQQSL